MTKIQQIKHQQSIEYWKHIIIAQQQSGLNATEYCRQQDIKYNAFYYWLRKVREKIADSMPQLPAETTTNTQFAVLSAATVTTTVPAPGTLATLKLSCGPAVIEITEQTSTKLLMQALQCIKDVFPSC